MDHLIGYPQGLPPGLRHIIKTLPAIVAGRPDSVTMHKGIAASAWGPYAGLVPLIIQSTMARPDDTARQQVATPEEAVRRGLMPLPWRSFVRGLTEADALARVADSVREACRFEIPVICHIYPRDPRTGQILFTPEDIAWAARCAIEAGADVVKVPYCGDVQAYAQIVADSPVPVVAAGGPQVQDPPRGPGDALRGRPERSRARSPSDATSGASSRSPPPSWPFKARHS